LSKIIFPQGLFQSPFQPAWWLRGAHTQTLFSTLLRKPPVLQRQRELVFLEDGDFLEIDWLVPETWQERQPLTMIVHGLSGSSESHYVLGLQASLAKKGWASVALNCRGASGRPNNQPRAYHAGSSDDLLQVMMAIQKKLPHTPLALVGYSLGGNMTLKLLGREKENLPLFAAAAVSVPFLLASCADKMDKGFSKIYRRHFMTELTAMWQEKLTHFEAIGNAEAAQRIRPHLAHAPFKSFWQFDNDLVAPLHGFQDVHDYYYQASSRQFLPTIAVPTLVIQSQDDPFMSADVLPKDTDLSAAISFELSQKGGHVGFVEGGSPKTPHYYLEHRIPDFLHACWQERK
jgi:hypothetical protein